ncbi:MAG: universal stress protein [Halodesulfurarchaeum sp.]
MYTVLLPVDTSVSRAERQATYTASLPNASESVSVVVGHALTGEDEPENAASIQEVESVRNVVDILESAGIEYELRELSTPPEEGILAVAADQSFDQIVMGGRKRSPAEKAILGSITQKVILNANVPVVVTACD